MRMGVLRSYLDAPRSCSGGGLDGDLEAELFELLHEVAAASFGIDAAIVVVVAHLVVGDTFGQHPPDHHEEVVADGVDGAFMTSTF